MEAVQNREICACGEKSVAQAIDIFKETTLPYKKAKKLVTGCNKTCCRRPLMALFNMVEFGEVDYEEIDFLIDQMQSR
jgi:DNA-directed RNA polymerase subunit N (RpoN/RPB10)